MKSLALGMVFLLTVCFSSDSQAQTLEWKLEKGQSLAIESSHELVTIIKWPDGSEQEMPMKQQIDTEWKISDSDEKSFAVEAMIKRVRTSMKSPLINVDYDSEKKEEPKDPAGKQIAASTKQTLGIPVAIKIGRRGNLLEMKLPETFQKLGSSPANPLPSGSLEPLFAPSEQLQLPEGEMTLGRQWERSINSNVSGLQTKSQVKYRYEGTILEGGRKLAKFHTDLTTELVQSPPEMEIALEDTGSDGEIFFDVELGCISKAVQRQKFRVSMNVGGRKLSQDIEGSTTTIYRLAN